MKKKNTYKLDNLVAVSMLIFLLYFSFMASILVVIFFPREEGGGEVAVLL